MIDDITQPLIAVPGRQITPMDMLNMAVSQNADLDKLEKLMVLQTRWEENEARKAYVVAISEFKKNTPTVFKGKTVSYETSKGLTQYTHALLEDAADIIGTELAVHGLSFRWLCDQLDGGMVKVTCVITHVQGHSESVSLQAGLDQSGGKNNIQSLGSTITYLQRYTLFAATGMAAKGIDNDGNGPGIEYITESQAADLNALLDEVGGDKEKFCFHFKIGKIEELPVKAYEHAVALIEARRKKPQSKA